MSQAHIETRKKPLRISAETIKTLEVAEPEDNSAVEEDVVAPDVVRGPKPQPKPKPKPRPKP